MNMAALESGRGVRLLNPEEDHTFSLDEDSMNQIFGRDDVKDRYVVVLSVAGAFRKGKSFILNFFLRYLNHKYNLKDNGDWLGDEKVPLKGFSWRGGSERHTTGLVLWSQPFLTTINGDKVAIFLMDTQGTFDSSSTVKDNATVFALSTMLSSVQIYNVSQNIEEDDLQHLQLFTDYGRLALENTSGKPFQKLELLVRDWNYAYEYPYGAGGGAQLLEKRLQLQNNQHEELQSLRRHIKECFEEIGCFLMPHPGLIVATDPQFTGTLADISSEFKTSLRELVPMLLAPDNLICKKIAGQLLKAKDMVHYFKAYMTVFNGSDLPEPKTILAATAEANNLSALSESRDVYEYLMEEVVGGSKPYLDQNSLEQQHERAKNKALHAFQAKRKMGGTDLESTYQDRLVKEIDEQYVQYRANNDAKKLLNFTGTPMILGSLVLLGLLLSFVGDNLGIRILVVIGQIIAVGAILTLGVWIYSRITGEMREIGVTIDRIMDEVRNVVMMKAVSSATQELTTPLADKKDS
ncbi:unnamed protein product [Leptosia nina]|uniref:GB1/RHD3-type G domain-containing protein n=1 Tax=Leptosia nina TaxID=320188 RepID=A0AAV1JDQ7_9NEOP